MRQEDDEYVPLRTVYADPHGSVTTDGNVYQAWWKHSQTHVERVGYIFRTRGEAIDALEAARKEAS